MQSTSDITRFLGQLKVERGLSAHTRVAYRRDLELLINWMQTHELTDIRALDTHQIRGFIADQHRRGLSAKSLQRVLSACRSFFHGLMREGQLKLNPAQGVRAPKAPRKLPQVLDADEVAAFVEIPTDEPIDLRDRAILELFYSSALRVSELVNLRWQDLDLNEGLVRVTGKGNKTRLVPIGRIALQALIALRTQRAVQSDYDAPVFGNGRGGALTPRAVQLRLKHWAREQGIWKRVHPHLLRHSCASHLLESSGDLRAVQELLGHADIGTTQIYTHLNFQHLAQVYDAAHPRARRKRET